MDKLEELYKELFEIEKTKKKLEEELRKEMFALCKKEYEGKLIVREGSAFKINKIVSVRRFLTEWSVQATGKHLRYVKMFDGVTVPIGDSFTIKGGKFGFSVTKEGKLTDGYKLSENIEDFNSGYNSWVKNFNKFRDARGNLITCGFTAVHFFEDNKPKIGIVSGYDTDKEKFKIKDITSTEDINAQKFVYLKGEEIIKADTN